MAGINRLGKAPPRPGSLRPPDPNRNKTLDVFSEGTEGDADYMRMVQDIEDTQGGQGWLFSRGAFDKGDLLYLRDEEEKKRFKEEELRDSERMQFLRMQASTGVPKDVPPPLPPKPPNPEKGPARSQSKLLASIVRVGAAPVKRGRDAAPSNSAQAKRAKPDSAMPAAPAQPSAARDGKAQQDHEAEQESSDEKSGLAGLFGEYASDEDDEDSLAGTGAKQQEELKVVLSEEGSRPGAGTEASHQQSPNGQTYAAADSVEEEAVDYD